MKNLQAELVESLDYIKLKASRNIELTDDEMKVLLLSTLLEEESK